MTLSLHHIGLSTRDLTRRTALLVCLLGAEVLPAPETGHVLLQLGGARLALVPWREGDPDAPARGDHLAFSLPRGAREELLRRAGALGCASSAVEGRLYLRDHEGLTLELLFV